MPLELIDYEQYTNNLVIQQFKESNFPLFIKGFNEELTTLESVFDDISNMFNYDWITDPANGWDPDGLVNAYLDLIGKIVGLRRGNRDNLTYLTDLKTKATLNQSSGTPDEIIQFVIFIYDLTINDPPLPTDDVIDFKNLGRATYQLTINSIDIIDIFNQQYLDTILAVSPAGVNCVLIVGQLDGFEYSEDPRPVPDPGDPTTPQSDNKGYTRLIAVGDDDLVLSNGNNLYTTQGDNLFLTGPATGEGPDLAYGGKYMKLILKNTA